MLSERINRVQISPTMAISVKAKALRAQGEDVLSFDVGEPDFDTPHHIKEACITALHNGDTHYTAAQGTPQILDAIRKKMQRENRLSYDTANIVVSVGAKHSLFNIFQCILNPGDQVIIPAPYWVSYPDQVLLAEGEPIILEAGQDQNFKISAQQLDECLKSHDRVKALIINSPSNPTGAVYSRAQLEELCAVLENYPDVLVISDEVYEHMVYAPHLMWSIAQHSEEFRNRTVVVQSCSKSYAMTGWRIGWTCSSPELAFAMTKLQSQSTSNPTSFAMAGAVTAVSNPVDSAMMAEFETRGRAMRDLLNRVPGFECFQPEGAFYLFPNVKGALDILKATRKQIVTSHDLADYLLSAGKVAVVPGEAFGTPGFLRFSYATSLENIEKGVGRISDVLNS